MPDDREGKPKQVAESQGAKANAGSGEKAAGDPAAAHVATDAKPCCCNYQLCLEYVDIREPTGMFISSLFDDHVYMQVTDCKGKTSDFPKDPKHQKLGKGKHAWTESLALIESDKADNCKLDCTVTIQVRKEPLFNRILDEILKLEVKLRAALAKLAQDSETLRKMLSSLTPGGAAIQKAIADIIADQHLIDDLTAQLASLTKALVGTDDTLMREIGVVFAGDAPCQLPDKKDWLENVLEPQGWTKDTKNPNRATLDFEIKAHDGEWHLGFAIYRICPTH